MNEAVKLRINWSSPLGMNQLHRLPEGGGVYVWIYPTGTEFVQYIGETVDFATRTLQHFATVIEHGGTVILSDNPYSVMRQDHINQAIAEEVILVARDNEPQLALARLKKVLDYFSQLQILFGSIEYSDPDRLQDDNSFRQLRRDIEAGLIKHVVKRHKLGHWGRVNNTIIGKVMNEPTATYEIEHAGEGAEMARNIPLPDTIE